MRVRSLLLGCTLAGALSILPADARSAPDTTTEADSLYTLAGELYAQHRYHDAIPLFRRVIELDPRHGNAYALLGGAYFQLGDYPHAIGAFERALDLDEGIKLAYLGLVASNYLTERVEAAQHWVHRLVPLLTGAERERYLTMIAAQFPRLDLSGT